MHLNIINNIPIAPKSLSLQQGRVRKPCDAETRLRPIFLHRIHSCVSRSCTLPRKKNMPVMGHLVQKARVVVWLIKYPSYQWVFHIRGKGFAHSWLKNRRTTMVIKNDHKTVYQSSMNIIRYTDTHLY